MMPFSCALRERVRDLARDRDRFVERECGPRWQPIRERLALDELEDETACTCAICAVEGLRSKP